MTEEASANCYHHRAHREHREVGDIMRRDARDHLSGAVVEAAIEVHRATGPGLLESVYQACLEHELRERGVPFEAAKELPVLYRGERLHAHLRLDLLVAGQLVVELKSVERLHPIHTAQVITYLRLSGQRRALLMNFNVRWLLDGIRRIAL